MPPKKPLKSCLKKSSESSVYSFRPSRISSRKEVFVEPVPPSLPPDDDELGDLAAQKVLREHRRKQEMRVQDQTRDKLGTIQDRISRALSKYELESGNYQEGSDGTDILLDRKQSEQEFDVYIVGFRDSNEKKYKLLESLYAFFQIYEDEGDLSAMEEEEIPINLEECYSTASNALESANNSLLKLSNIHEMLIDGYQIKLKDKENKRKTKKLEQAFKEAQNEMLILRDTLAETQNSLSDATTKAESLRKALDSKSSEIEKNKVLIEKLRKQAENSLTAEQRRVYENRTALLTQLEKDAAELRLTIGQLEFLNRIKTSEAMKNTNESSATESKIAELENKILAEREKMEESLREAKEGLEAEHESILLRQKAASEVELDDLRGQVLHQAGIIDNLEYQISELKRPVTESELPSSDPTPIPTPEPPREPTPVPPRDPTPELPREPTPEPPRELTPEPPRRRPTPWPRDAPPSEVETSTVFTQTNSDVSIDPTEALSRKYRELEEEFEKRREAVEEAMQDNDKQNRYKIEQLNSELQKAKESWEAEKFELEGRVEEFRRMVAEMEATTIEKTHELSQKINKDDIARDIDLASVEGSVDSEDEQDREEKEEEVTAAEEEEDGGGGDAMLRAPSVIIRPSTAVRNTFTPGPENPVIKQVLSMYDHVSDFKEKLVDILLEIQNMGVIDETEAMLMKRSVEQIRHMQFNRNEDISKQIEDIQSNIAEVMHSSEKAIHKLFKKLSKEKSKINNLSFIQDLPQPDTVSETRSNRSRKSVRLCDRATSPVMFYAKPSKTPHTRRQQVRATYTAMFAHHDMEFNKKNLKLGVNAQRITPNQYQEAVDMMGEYTSIPQRRLRQIAKHYISHARMQIMEENIQMNRPVCDDIDDVLNRLDELYLLRKKRYGAEMEQLATERESLAYLLTKQLDRLQSQSGIFLIKPYIAYKANQSKTSDKTSEYLFRSMLSKEEEGDVDVTLEGEENGGRDDIGDKPLWSVESSRAPDVERWMSEVPRLLEMDVNRLTVGRNTVSQPILQSGKVGNNRTIKSFVVVRPTKINRSSAYRPKSSSTTAEFISVTSDRAGREYAATHDNLPPLRASVTSGYVSTQPKLLPLSSPPSSISVEKAKTISSPREAPEIATT